MKKVSKKRIVIYIILAILVLFGAFKFGFYDTEQFEKMEIVSISFYHGNDDYWNNGTMDLKTIKSQKTMERIKDVLRNQTFVRTWKKAEKMKEKAINIKVNSEDERFTFRIYKANKNKNIMVINGKSYKSNDIWDDLYDILMDDSNEDILEYNVKYYRY